LKKYINIILVGIEEGAAYLAITIKDLEGDSTKKELVK
jgi:hypothetical protein